MQELPNDKQDMNYTIKNISQIIHGSGSEDVTQSICHLLIDSRKIVTPEVSLFFAIKGERNDGHNFIWESYQKKVRNFVVSKLPSDIARFHDGHFILVKDTMDALQQLCAHHRRQFNIPVIGITGSNGKTIVKEWLYQLMRDDKHIVRSPKSYNSQVGVPLSVWQLNETHNMALFEAGISRPTEMKRLEHIIFPTIGLITNIGQSHDENFTDKKQKIREKLMLFIHAHTLIYCRDYLELNEEIMSNPALKKTNLFTWSKKVKSNLQIGKITKEENESEIQGVFNNNFIHIKIPFTDDASIENAIHCWSVMLFLEYTNEKIAERMHQLNPVAMRLELKEGINNCSIINDSYNSDLGSLTIALDFLNQQKQHPEKTLVLSDILQSGKNDEDLYKEVAHLLSEKGVHRLFGIGEAILRQANQFDMQKVFFKTTEDFLHHYHAALFNNETILLKGARLFGFERISQILQQKAHETILEINLNAIIHNMNYFRSKLTSETKIMAMVKAFSYGSGGFEIANILQYHRADYLAVAYTDEGVELRKAGITLPIMVMNPEEQSYGTMIQYNLEPEIFNFRVLKLFNEAFTPSICESRNGLFPIHIKLDTGMHRLGFTEKEINELVVRIKNCRNLKINSVFSHLSSSNEPEQDEFTRLQIKKFGEMSETILNEFDYPILRHILNSTGITRFPGAQFEMVRIGIGLYGIGANHEEQKQLQNVSTLKTSISQIKNISTGDSVGYNRRFISEQEMKIATVPIGYADGLSRQLGNGKGKMLVNGKTATIVGNICMDMCMLDVTNISCEEGDEVIVFGEEYPIYELAKDMRTIPYEVFTGISRRVKRVYFHE
ncbi:MAG: bifunctional UDP-N-acetylmuramoyl-tripeptide:D-alanyl-D-alanine ligase/alanine racemase [Bacteroidota bacterium]